MSMCKRFSTESITSFFPISSFSLALCRNSRHSTTASQSHLIPKSSMLGVFSTLSTARAGSIAKHPSWIFFLTPHGIHKRPRPPRARILMSPEASALAACVHAVCQNLCVDVSQDLVTLCKVMVSCFIKVENKIKLLDDVAPGVYVDLDQLCELQTHVKSGNAIGDSDVWIEFLFMLEFTDPAGGVLEQKASVPCMYALHGFLSQKDSWTFTDTCRLFLLSNVENLGYKYTVSRFIARRLGKMNVELGNKIMEIMVEERHKQGAFYHQTLVTILSGCKLEGNKFQLAMSAHKEQVMGRQSAWTMQSHAKARGRFSVARLVDRLERQRLVDAPISAEQDSTVIKMTFPDFQQRVRFPNSMSPLWRQRCYLLASQGHLFDFRAYVSRVIPGQVCDAVGRQEVAIPDPIDLSNAITTLVLSDMPFKELKAFRATCFVGYVDCQLTHLNMTGYMHLYVASYQKPDIWKQCWKEIYPLMSTQIAKNVETFVRDHPFAVEEFVKLVEAGSPFR